jgi:hypothetical protein
MLKGEDLIKLWSAEDDRDDTSNLQFYKSFKEKKNVFGTHVRFESSSQFMYFINYELPDLLGSQIAVYRGLSSAKYRLFNNAQRSYKNNKKNNPKDELYYHEGIAQLIANARSVNNGVLSAFFKATGLKDSHLSVLSFLQHYGAPTPFMDWTTDHNVALFFAIMSMKDEQIDSYHNGSVDYEIEDYFSLTVMIKDQALNQINDFRQLNATNTGSVNYNRLKKKKVQFIEEMYKSGRPSLSLVNNLHIVNQKGLFIYNNSPNLPLEEVFFKYWKGYYLMNMSYEGNTPRSPMICIDIHKSVAFHIREQLRKAGYTKKVIFSKPEDIAKSAIPKIFKSR